MASIKDMLQANTADILEATELLKVLGDRAGQFVWKQLTTEGGDFVAFVTADDENSYPDGGMQDGYWYELVEEGLDMSQFYNFSKIAIDTFTPTNNTYNFTISHSLGIVPKVAIVIAMQTIESQYYPIRSATVIAPSASDIHCWTHSSKGSSAWRTYEADARAKATTTQISYCAENATVYVKAGVTYKVITMG